MEYNTIKKPLDKEQKCNGNYLEMLNEKCNEEQELLTAEMQKLGHAGTMQDFIRLVPDLNEGHSEASLLISLQERCVEFIEKRKQVQNTIVIEPARLPENVDSVEQLLINNAECGIYQRAGTLVRVTKINALPKDKKNKIKRAQDALIIKELDQLIYIIWEP